MRRYLPFLLVATLVPAPASTAAEQKTPNLTVEYKLPFHGGTELATDGRYIYAGQWNGRTDRGQLPKQGGVKIFDSQATPPKLVGTIKCAGTDMDVAIVRAGVLAIGHHGSACGVRGNGVTTFDVSNPAKPKKLGSIAVPSAHTLTPVPGTNVVYVSPGGTGSAQGLTTVLDLKDAKRPRILRTFSPDRYGCHDVTFQKTLTGRTLGACTGLQGIRLWDMTDPAKPVQLSQWASQAPGRDHQIQFPHGSAISPDGGLLVVNDEAFFGHRCDGTDPTDAGALFLYDITDAKAPRYLGNIVPPRGKQKASTFSFESWCTSHQLNFIPNSRRLVNAWFTGGTSVWDLTIPVRPREEAYYMPSNALTWTSHWFNDRIWINDLKRGVEVVKMSLLPTGGPVGEVSKSWRPASDRAVPILFERPAPGAVVCPA